MDQINHLFSFISYTTGEAIKYKKSLYVKIEYLAFNCLDYDLPQFELPFHFNDVLVKDSAHRSLREENYEFKSVY